MISYESEGLCEVKSRSLCSDQNIYCTGATGKDEPSSAKGSGLIFKIVPPHGRLVHFNCTKVKLLYMRSCIRFDDFCSHLTFDNKTTVLKYLN